MAGSAALPFGSLEESDQLSHTMALPRDYVDQFPGILSHLVGDAIEVLFRFRNYSPMFPAKHRRWLLDHNRLPDHGGRGRCRRWSYIHHNGLCLHSVAACDRELG